MKVLLKSRAGVRGEVKLVDGRAVGSNTRTRLLLDHTKIIEPDTFKLLDPSDGERYLRALPDTLSGAYMVAELVE